MDAVHEFTLAMGVGTACRERHNQLTHPTYSKPGLLATAPDQVWSWDSTKLKGLAKWTCLPLHMKMK